MNSPTPLANPLKVAVMGAGAVGCYYGGMLARAGHDVVLIGRAQHVEAVNQHGLRMETRTFDERVPMKASTDASAIDGAQLVLFCVKSTDTEATGVQMLPFLAPGAQVLTLQNGVDNADRLRGAMPGCDVMATVVYVATEMAGPGHVKHHGRGELVVEQTATSGPVLALLAAAGVPAEQSTNVRGSLWAKLILNAAYNAMSAITQLPYGELVKREGVADAGGALATLVAECLAVARADGVTVPGDVNKAVRMIAETMPGQYSSTAQDLKRGKPSEIDYLNGFVARRGQALGVPTPANHLLWVLVKALESKAAK